MDILSIILIAVGLSMDSFAVSITNGLTIKNMTTKKVLLIAGSLAIFQALMPLLGWVAGVGVEKYIKEIDHWIAFILLGFIGVKMIYEGITKDESPKEHDLKPITLIGQSIATSIDALVVGVSFAFLSLPIITPVIVIGIVTLVFSLFGLYLGKCFGKKLGSSIEIFGGIVLLGIGIKILIEHLYF